MLMVCALVGGRTQPAHRQICQFLVAFRTAIAAVRGLALRGQLAPQGIGERTSVAMQAAKRQGRHMGRVSMLPQATSDRLLTLRASYTLAGTAVQLNAEGLTTATGGTWTANSVGKARARLLTA